MSTLSLYGIGDPIALVRSCIAHGRIKPPKPVNTDLLIKRKAAAAVMATKQRRTEAGLTQEGKPRKRRVSEGQSRDRAVYMRQWRQEKEAK